MVMSSTRVCVYVRTCPSLPRVASKLCGGQEPVYQAIWAENTDFDEVLISPTMINDHMPDNVMDALLKVTVVTPHPRD